MKSIAADNNEQQAFPVQMSGNDRERLVVSSGQVVVIDQFMLSNPQFLSRFSPAEDSSGKALSDQDLLEAIENFGGCSFSLPIGSYRVYRDPMRFVMALYLEESIGGNGGGEEEQIRTCLENLPNASQVVKNLGQVFIDTRCLVFSDLALLKNQSVLERYGQLRRERRDKEARDYLREQGAAVRYGFQRFGDVLGVYQLQPNSLIALWP